MNTEIKRILLVTLSICIFGSILAGCAGSSLRVTSVPEGSDVYVVPRVGAPKKVGETPFVVDPKAISDSESRYIHLQIKKDNFLTETVLVPKSSLKSEYEIGLSMVENTIPESCANQTIAMQDLASRLAQAQVDMFTKDYEQARKILESLKMQYSNVSVIHDLLGNLYYLEKDLDRALASYRVSNELMPNNPETRRMIQKISQMRGGEDF